MTLNKIARTDKLATYPVRVEFIVSYNKAKLTKLRARLSNFLPDIANRMGPLFYEFRGDLF